jgi:hypothetical protein
MDAPEADGRRTPTTIERVGETRSETQELTPGPRRKAPKMLIHLVLFKPRPSLTEIQRHAFATAFERAVREIPSVRRVHVGKRVTHGAGYERTVPDAADFVGMIEFDDLPGLQEYLKHPAHEELGALFHSSLASAMVYDFEVGGLENLAGLIAQD